MMGGFQVAEPHSHVAVAVHFVEMRFARLRRFLLRHGLRPARLLRTGDGSKPEEDYHYYDESTL
jgi:hypothetical protein